MRVRNLIYTTAGHIDCQIEHPTLGWIPFTASPDDPEQFGREIFEKASRGELGIVAPVGAEAIAASEKESREQLERAERNWRDAELARADVAINKLTDGETDVVGTVEAWRSYRVSLRAWPTSEYFPQASHRPTAPDLEIEV